MDELNTTQLEARWVHPESGYTPPEDEHETICIHCQIARLQEAHNSLSGEVHELTENVNHLIRMLGGK